MVLFDVSGSQSKPCTSSVAAIIVSGIPHAGNT